MERIDCFQLEILSLGSRDTGVHSQVSFVTLQPLSSPSELANDILNGLEHLGKSLAQANFTQ